MAPLGEKEKKQLMGFIAFLGIAAGGLFWYFWHQPKAAEMSGMRVRIDSLSTRVEEARKDLAQGSIEALRQRVAEYQRAVVLMRRLVPTGSEVPNLIDDVSTRAKLRGVNISQITPLGVEGGVPFQTDRYRFGVAGRFDQIGEFLSDVGSLPRIMVPYDVSITLAGDQARRVVGDTTGALLEVDFQLRTFVKPAAAADSAAPAGAAQ
jgi:type IV pilus assembly protein PilO